jgi:isoleucyl-tRNA synthetase
MKAGLPTKEPQILAKWTDGKLYQTLQKANKGKKQFILHDGPPYANGVIHIGHALNKILKDIIVRSKMMAGFDAPYIPGWDCHGLPIEHKIELTHGKNLPASKVRELCRTYADEQINLQKEDFIRLGVLGDWENPYKTINFDNEANEIRALGKIVEKGLVFRNLKPTNWCFDCGSALAEAEIEYQDKKSDSIDVAFLAANNDAIAKAFNIAIDKPVAIVIWTTTPWTIPSNQALNVHPDYEYALVDTGDKYLILASELVEDCLKRYELQGEIKATTTGKNLEQINFKHPFYNRLSPVYLAEYGELGTGTGIVHSAPAYGEDDFYTCKKYGMQNDEILTPVQSNGVFAEDLEFFGGQFIWKAQKNIIDKLKEVGSLMAYMPLVHSYMHCWRHKTPLIYRATNQWFIGMKDLRSNALKAVDATAFFPEWGRSRLHSMIANRPDWCISRQRNWGVPIPFLINKTSGQLHPQTLEIMEKVAVAVEKDGIEAWWNLTVADLITENIEDYEKINDTLDVWFDSGTTHFHVLKHSHPILKDKQADLYLEGSDQHRGWFHSSLLTGVAIDGFAPYKALLTHGFTVDENGRKMSKSLGNTVAPQDIINQMGADILRLWVASSDYSGDMSVSKQILERTADSYRRIRNTLRFLLANLNGFDASTDLVPHSQMIALDKWAVDLALNVQNEVVDLYEKYQFWSIYQKIHNFCSNDLGAKYLDIIKDRQYTTGTNSLARKSCQTAMWHILQSLVRLIAPILPFTSDEIWDTLGHSKSIAFETYYTGLTATDDKMDNAFFEKAFEARSILNKELENLRNQKVIGNSLQAEVTLFVGEEFKGLSDLGDELKFLFLTSKAVVAPLYDAPENALTTENANIKLLINKTDTQKCERCWHYSITVGQNSEHKTICLRCVENVFGKGELRKFA